MNRPRYKDFTYPNCETPLESWYSYAFELERYCDELEKINERMVWHVKKCNEQSTKIRQLEKALDKACKVLDCDNVTWINGVCNLKHKEQWKEHFLKEVDHD